MTTDNRTNGQIVAKALVAHCEDHKMPFPRGSIKKIVEALRVAGRLAGEPTEAQVEAAGAERDAALARIAEAAKLADQWIATPDYTPSEYDKGRVDQRHDMTMQLLEALGLDEGENE